MGLSRTHWHLIELSQFEIRSRDGLKALGWNVEESKSNREVLIASNGPRRVFGSTYQELLQQITNRKRQA